MTDAVKVFEEFYNDVPWDQIYQLAMDSQSLFGKTLLSEKVLLWFAMYAPEPDVDKLNADFERIAKVRQVLADITGIAPDIDEDDDEDF